MTIFVDLKPQRTPTVKYPTLWYRVTGFMVVDILCCFTALPYLLSVSCGWNAWRVPNQWHVIHKYHYSVRRHSLKFYIFFKFKQCLRVDSVKSSANNQIKYDTPRKLVVAHIWYHSLEHKWHRFHKQISHRYLIIIRLRITRLLI